MRDLSAFYADRPALKGGRARLATLGDAILDVDDRIGIAEHELLAPLDRQARNAIATASKQVSAVTALSPRAIVDVAFVVYAAVRLLRRIAAIYGGRPGFLGFIRLARAADLIVVAPATADLLAKMAGGHADDLASCVLLATDKPVLVAPAMNPRMWLNAATQRNVALLQADGIGFVGPAVGEMAEAGEAGPGRLSEVPELLAAILDRLGIASAAGDKQERDQ